MSRDTVVFDPQAMREVAADIEVRGDMLAEVATDVSRALSAYAASGSEFVVAVSDHQQVIAAQGDMLVGLATSVLLLAEAADEADRRGLDLTALRQYADPLATAATLHDRHDSIVRLLRASVHGTRDLRAAREQVRLVQMYGPRPMPAIEAIRQELPGGEDLRRSQVRQVQKQRYRELKKQRTTLARTRATARLGLRTNAPVTQAGTRVNQALSASRAGQALRHGSRALGGAGVALGAYDTFDAFQDGDYQRMATSGLSTVGGVLLLSGNPVTMGAGAVIVVGVMVYDNWDTISSWGSSAANTVSNAGRGLVDGAKKLFGGLF
jgi:hypothetical protein